MDGKFAMIPLEMFEDESLKPLDIVVYSALDTFVNAFGKAWPSLSRLTERALRIISTNCTRDAITSINTTVCKYAIF